MLVSVAALNGAVLVLTAGHQIYDTNFYTLWEATALLAGDHPYQDFFEWGAPLQAVVSMCAQVIAGNRLIGEFMVQWLGITIGAVVSFHLGLRLTRSVSALLLMVAFSVAILAATATYHYPKLLWYPLAVWVMWRYMEAPGVRRAAVMGLVTAAAFLFRHDHGVYVAGAAALAVVLTRLVAPESRRLRAAVVEGGGAAAAALIVLSPWLLLVQLNEGVPAYVEARLQRYAVGSPYSNPYWSLLTMNPVRALTPELPPAPVPVEVSFEWQDRIRPEERDRLAREHGLRLLRGPDADNRWHYEAQDRFSPRLLGLQGSIDNTAGIDWARLSDLRWPLPPRAESVMWLQQMALAVPLLLLGAAGLEALRSRRMHRPVPLDVYRVVLAAVFLAIVDWRLFREPGYVVGVAPLTAALGAWLIGARPIGTDPRTAVAGWSQRVWPVTSLGVAFVLLVVTAVSICAFVRGTHIFTPWRLAAATPGVLAELLASPPIEGFAPAREVFEFDRSTWNAQEVDMVRVLLRYVHDCTAPGDRVLVTGQTPFQVGYYVARPIAGGHLYWHEAWRADPARELQSLSLLQRQSVPFAYSTHDPVLDDFRRYPRIREYLLANYTELEGSRGLLLVDTRRQPTGEFGSMGFPCFREGPRTPPARERPDE